MNKKITALFLVGAMTLSMAACGSSSQGDSSNASGSAAGTDTSSVESGGSAEAVDLDVENVEDLYVTWPSLGGAPTDLQMVEDAVNEIVTPKLGVNVILQSMPLSDLTSQQQLLISSGENIDLVCMLWTGLDTWLNTESLLELEDYLPTYGAEMTELLGDAVYGGSARGHVYGIPTIFGGNRYGMFARSDILEKYGYDTEDHSVTIDELEEMFATIKAGEGDGFYPVAGGGSFQCIGGRYDSLGASMYTGVVMMDDDPDKIVDVYETEAFADYAQLMYDWAQAGYISADAATSEETPQTLLATGTYLGAFAPIAQATKNSYGSNGAVPLTLLEIIPGYTTTGDLTAVMWGVSSMCEIPEKAVAFLNELYTNTDVATLLTFGIEGVHYEITEEDPDTGWRLVQMPEGVDSNNSGYYVALGVWNMGGNTIWSTDAGYAELEEKETQKTYETSPAFGYTFDSSDYSNEVAALAAVYNEYYKIIDCGAIDPATELPAFIDALKAANIDTVIEANQAQYDEWRASQGATE